MKKRYRIMLIIAFVIVLLFIYLWVPKKMDHFLPRNYPKKVTILHSGYRDITDVADIERLYNLLGKYKVSGITMPYGENEEEPYLFLQFWFDGEMEFVIRYQRFIDAKGLLNYKIQDFEAFYDELGDYHDEMGKKYSQ